MNIKQIIKQGLTGEEVGKLFLEDYTDYHFRLGETAKRHKNKEISQKEALSIKGLLSESEKETLYNSLKNDRDIKSYNNYMAILKYLDDIAIKMAYFQEVVYSGCLRLAYLIVTRTENNKLKLEDSLPKIIKNIEENFYLYLTMKTTILLIEETTENKNILNSINYEPDKLEDVENLLNLKLEDFAGKYYEKNNKILDCASIQLKTIKIKNLDDKETIFKGVEIPEELINKAREEIQDLSFFRNGDYQLHQILIGGLEDE